MPMPGQYQQNPKNMQTKKQAKEADKKRKALEKEAHKQNTSTGQSPGQTQIQSVETPQQEYARIAQTIAQRNQLAREAGAKEGQAVRTGLQTAQGFSPDQARLMQYEAHKNIQRQEQAAQRNLVGDQGTRGIGGRSGIAYAQRRDMNQTYAGQHQQAQSDYNRLNEAQKFANFGAEYGAAKGEEARFGTDWQAEQEKLDREKYKKANPDYAKEAFQQFYRIKG